MGFLAGSESSGCRRRELNVGSAWLHVHLQPTHPGSAHLHTMPREPNTPPPSLDWADLQYFGAVGRSGSIAGAARALRVNHSTVLRRIASLEAALGVRLFDRLPGGYALTTARHELDEHLARVHQPVGAAQRQQTRRDAAINRT